MKILILGNKKFKILVIDDNTDFLDLFNSFVKKTNTKYKIETLETAENFLDVIQARKPDLIVCDFEMPKFTGLHILKSLKDNNIQTPFILCSGKKREDIILEALNLNVDYFVQKMSPIILTFKELLYFINRAIENKKLIEFKNSMEKKPILKHKKMNEQITNISKKTKNMLV
jgi:DNA-binding NtrC family response regulator